MTSISTVAIVDYGMGNLRSVWQAAQLAAADLPCNVVVTQDAQTVREADRIILPGQGAMPDCMAHLQASGLQEVLLQVAKSKPFLGICVGMQMLLDSSEEGSMQCLGLIPGAVKKFQLAGQIQSDGSRYKVPQMGWNRVYQKQAHPLWQGIDDGAWFYFVHSYYAQVQNAQHCAGQTHYGQGFASAIARDNLFAAQFHPEKSAQQGLRLYRNFLLWNP